METPETDHYATLGLDAGCSTAQIRDAYRMLAMQHHPDRNPDSPQALAFTQCLNEAHETLSDPARRRTYDRERELASAAAAPRSRSRIERNVSQELQLRLEELVRGATLEVRVRDPSNPNGEEIYPLEIPAMTAPGARFRVPREHGGFVLVKVKAGVDFRFKIRGSDLRCDLRIRSERAQQGGTESVRGVEGNYIRVEIPPGVGRGEILRIPHEGLPKPRGGRGELMLRITYRVDVRFSR